MPQKPKPLDDTKSMRDWWGKELRNWRNIRGLSSKALGRKVHLSGTMIERIEKNERPCDAELASNLDDALEAGGALRRLWRRVEEEAAQRTADADNAGLTRLPGSVAAEPWERLALALDRGSKIDSHSAVTLIGHSAELHMRELSLSPRCLRDEVESHLDAITAALPRAGVHERALTIAAGETAALAGWVAWDLGEQEKASAYYKVTSECAEAAGHPSLRALALTYASYGAATPERALELLSRAAQDVRGPGNATAAAWVHGRHAEEAARVGDVTSALRALDRARLSYDFADHTSEQSWVRFVTPYRMDSLALSVYGQLRRHELTATADGAIERLGTALPDSGVVVLGDLASALLRGGDVDQGVYVSRQFAAASQAKPNTMGKDRARTIAANLPDGERELAHHLRQFAS
ncbi:helix-turn-helix domain-containing protein [Streptomyces sp. NPDC059928]|uniref:helix-turn-helix domain-containing protein n=1 Tax=unclassified Streptomyces TaxID=2593676 RepID=UPI0036581AE7